MTTQDEQAEKMQGMQEAAVEAAVEFAKLMAKPSATAKDLVAFHQKWYAQAGHKRLGCLYRDYGK